MFLRRFIKNGTFSTFSAWQCNSMVKAVCYSDEKQRRLLHTIYNIESCKAFCTVCFANFIGSCLYSRTLSKKKKVTFRPKPSKRNSKDEIFSRIVSSRKILLCLRVKNQFYKYHSEIVSTLTTVPLRKARIIV